MAKRMRDVCGLPENEALWRVGRGFVVRDLPWNEEQTARPYRPLNLRTGPSSPLAASRTKCRSATWAWMAAFIPFHPAPRRARKQEGELALKERWYPIQVKQKDKVGRPDIDSFEAMMMREECDKGFFVAFDYSSDAMTEVSQFFKRSGKIIIPLTVREILDEEIARKLA